MRKYFGLRHFIQNFDCAKPFCISLNRFGGFITVYYRTAYSVLFGPEKYDVIYSRIRHLISQKSGITYGFSHKYAKIKFD